MLNNNTKVNDKQSKILWLLFYLACIAGIPALLLETLTLSGFFPNICIYNRIQNIIHNLMYTENLIVAGDIGFFFGAITSKEKHN